MKTGPIDSQLRLPRTPDSSHPSTPIPPRNPPDGLSMPSLEPLHPINIIVVILRKSSRHPCDTKSCHTAAVTVWLAPLSFGLFSASGQS